MSKLQETTTIAVGNKESIRMQSPVRRCKEARRNNEGLIKEQELDRLEENILKKLM